MGMSIDKAIEHGKEQLEIFGGEHKEFIETALDTMRKYQKIEQIVKVWHQDIYAKDFECMAEVAEVIKDGNDD